MKWNDCDTEEDNDNDQNDEEVGSTDPLNDEEDAAAFNCVVDETSGIDLDAVVDDESWMLDIDQSADAWETLPEMATIIANEFEI